MQRKSAFTIFETLMVLAITAVLIILSLKIFRNAEEKAYASLYAKAYKTLNTATYNIQKDVDDFNTEKNLEYQEQGQSGAPDSEKKHFPNISCGASCDSTVPTPEQLCTALVADDAVGDGNTVYGYINTTNNSCTLSSMTDFTANPGWELQATPSFVTTDGMRFYITDKQDDADYFYVWVDINGDRHPTRTGYVAGKKKPDVVPFLISKDTGVVVPQGLPMYDTTYMTARVISADPDLTKDYSIPMTYAQAQRIAFDNKTWTLDSMSTANKAIFAGTLGSYPATNSADTSIANSLRCVPSHDSNLARDFPPCTIEVSTFTQK